MQQTAFRKLLKKYKKWTGSVELGYRFSGEILDSPSSFSNTDLRPLVVQYDELLAGVRTLYEERFDIAPKGSNKTRPPPKEDHISSAYTQLSHVIQDGTQVDFDGLLATLPISADGKNASYWVHPDNLIELQILLLQYTRSFVPGRKQSACSSGIDSAQTESPASPSDTESNFQPDTFNVIIDDSARYLAQQNSQTSEESESRVGSSLQDALLHARATKARNARLTTGPLPRSYRSDLRKHISIKRNKLQHLCNRDTPFDARNAAPRSVSFVDSHPSPSKAIEDCRNWLVTHSKVNPLATISSKRSRLVSLHAGPSGLLLASLDTSINIRQGLSMEIDSGDGINSSFPYAVLRVRCEGRQPNDLFAILDESHLAERVRGFSLEHHAVWNICRPSNAAPPFWISLIEQDIRKVPQAPLSLGQRNAEASFTSQSTTPQISTSASSEADLGCEHKPSTDTLTDVPNQLQTPPLQAFRKKRRHAFAPKAKQQYWSEYDYPEDGDDENGYVLYIDPNSETFIDKLWTSILDMFRKRPSPEQRPLLSPQDPEAGLWDDDTQSSDDEMDTVPKRGSAHYGTLGPQMCPLPIPKSSRNKIWLPRVTVTCLASSTVIIIVAFILAATGRRKLMKEVDAGIIFAVASSLAFAVVGVATMFMHRQQLRWFGWAVAFVVLAFVGVASGGLLAWTVS